MRSVLLFALLLGFAAFIVAAQSNVTDTKPPAAVRSLFQACRSEVVRLCPRRRGVMSCLEGNATKVENVVCKEWLAARSACKADAEKSRCGKLPFRRCLLKLDEGDLSIACSGSDFYASMKRTQQFINRRSANPATGPAQ